MKHIKIIFALALALSATTAFASTKQEQVGRELFLVTYEDTDFNLNGILDEVSRENITPKGSTDPNAIGQVWGMNGYTTPKVRFGQVVTDEFGFTSLCNDFWGCFDISRTDYYRLPTLKYLVK